MQEEHWAVFEAIRAHDAEAARLTARLGPQRQGQPTAHRVSIHDHAGPERADQDLAHGSVGLQAIQQLLNSFHGLLWTIAGLVE